MPEPAPLSQWNFVCARCGWATACLPFDTAQVPGPPSCTQVYLSPPFPADGGDPNHHVSGPCNGVINRLLQ